MVNVYLFPADEGDFIWVRYGSNDKFSNIIIDGGTKDSAAEYAELIEYIDSRNETIEALILTHIDYDHLQGAVSGIAILHEKILRRTIKRILFNSCRGIMREQGGIGKKCAEDVLKGQIPTEGYGIDDAVAFMDLLKLKHLRNRLVDYIICGQVWQWGNGEIIRIISPGKKELNHFLNMWEPYCQNKQVTSYAGNMEMTADNLNTLMSDKLGNDPSVNNAASIAFLFEYEDIKIAFLADARPAVCVRGLKALGFDRYHADLVKLSHHGSKNNTSDTILKKLITQNYLLSTNGNAQKVPNKAVIAHILKNAEKEPIQVLCNYDWWEIVYYGKYFTQEDKEVYLDTDKLRLILLNDEGTKVRDGLKVYGER